MAESPTVPSPFALNVTLWVASSDTATGRPERFTKASRLFRRLHQIGTRKLHIRRVSDHGTNWTEQNTLALDL